MNETEIALKIVEVGGVVLLISAGFMWLIWIIVKKFINAAEDYPKKLEIIAKECHDTTLIQQKNYLEQLKAISDEKTVLTREVTTALIDTRGAIVKVEETLQSLKDEIRRTK